MNKYLQEKSINDLDQIDKPFFLTKRAMGYTGKEFNVTLVLVTKEVTKGSDKQEYHPN